MNHLLLAAAAGLALATPACQKAEAPPQGLLGEWNWVESRGGLTGNQTYSPASTGTTVRWLFRADSTVLVRTTQQGVAQPTQTGTHSLGTVRSIYSGQAARTLTLRLAQPRGYVLNELSSRLVVADNNPDGYTTAYERL